MEKLVLLSKRRSGMTREEFMTYYEQRHMVLATRYIGHLFQDFRRYYPGPMQPIPTEGSSQVDFIEPPMDAISVYTFKTADGPAEFQKLMQDEKIAQILVADEHMFLDRSSVLVGICDAFEGPGIVSPEFIR
ncbi:EthD domain-containing protein [Sphingobium faniae]|nr:EthD domain-containing protein [Sphingobium faniae]